MEQIRLGGTYDGYYTGGFADNSYFDTSHNLYEKDGGWGGSTLLGVMNAGVNTLNHLGHGNIPMPCIFIHPISGV